MFQILINLEDSCIEQKPAYVCLKVFEGEGKPPYLIRGDFTSKTERRKRANFPSFPAPFSSSVCLLF